MDEIPSVAFRLFFTSILDSIVVSIPACHAGDRGSIPRRGGFFVLFLLNEKLFLEAKGNVPAPGIEPGPAG